MYEKALFKAFVWTQAVENQVNDLVLHCINDGRLELNKKQHGRVENERATFSELIKMLKPCVEDDLYNRLEKLRCMRNKVVHHSDYVNHIIEWECQLESGKDLEEEIRQFKDVKIYAGETYGTLLGVFRFEDQTEHDC